MKTPETLARIDELKREIDSVRPLKPQDEQRVLEKFRLEWTYHSNAIEGNKLTFGETKAFLLEGLTAHGKPLKDHLDVQGHRELICYLEAFIAGKEKLTEAAIRGMHRILLVKPYKVEAVTPDGQKTEIWVTLGEYKSKPNCVVRGAGQVHQYVLPLDTPVKMAELLAWHRKQEENPTVHPLVHAALFHHTFTNIHPFDDGNGRLARILMNLIIMQAGFPPIVIKTGDRDRYVFALRRADAGESADLVEFLAQELIWSEELFLRGARGENIEDVDDVDKAIRLLKQELQAVEEPVELSKAVQESLFTESLEPLLRRLFSKLSQFNELYSRVAITAAIQVWSVPSFDNVAFLGTSNVSMENALEVINRNRSGHVLRQVQMNISWIGFKRAGLNDFNCNTDLTFDFEKLKYTVASAAAKARVQKIYPRILAEEEIGDIVRKITKQCLAHIEGELKKK